MTYQPGTTAYIDFTINTASGAVDADSLPTATLRRNGAIDGAVTVTVVKLSTGAYVASVPVPLDYVVGDDLAILVSATVSSVAYKQFLGQGVVDLTVASRAVAGDLMGLADNAISSAKLATGAITAGKFATGALDANALATDAVTEIANGILGLSNGVESSLTPLQCLRLMTAVLAGEVSVSGNTITFYRPNGSTAALSITVDASGNRTARTIGTL
jgi:hypothetical protein